MATIIALLAGSLKVNRLTKRFDYKHLTILGGVLLILSVVLAFLMVLRIIQPTLLLNYIDYIFMLVGMILGNIGMMSMVKLKRDEKKRMQSGTDFNRDEIIANSGYIPDGLANEPPPTHTGEKQL